MSGLDPDTRRQLIEAVRRFVAERLRPLEARVAEDDAVPVEVIAEMRDLGLFGLSIPEQYGGLGLSMEDEVLVGFELGRTSPAFRSVFGTNVGIGSQALAMFGSEAQKAHWLPSIASGEIITAFALTEAEAGSDSGAVQTTARREGDHYVVSGTKRYITNAGRASLFTVIARTDQQSPGAAGVTALLIPSDLQGLSIGKAEKKMGQQGAQIHDVHFDRVRVPAANRIGDEGQGFRDTGRTACRAGSRQHLEVLRLSRITSQWQTGLPAYSEHFGRPLTDILQFGAAPHRGHRIHQIRGH